MARVAALSWGLLLPWRRVSPLKTRAWPGDLWCCLGPCDCLIRRGRVNELSASGNSGKGGIIDYASSPHSVVVLDALHISPLARSARVCRPAQGTVSRAPFMPRPTFCSPSWIGLSACAARRRYPTWPESGRLLWRAGIQRRQRPRRHRLWMHWLPRQIPRL